MSLRTQEQNQRFHQLLTQHKIDAETKVEIVKTHSGGRVESSSELSKIEMSKAIKFLEGKSEEQLKRMRAKALNLARALGLVTGEKPKIDFSKLNTWIATHCHKAYFYEVIDTAELSKVITGLENWNNTKSKKT